MPAALYQYDTLPPGKWFRLLQIEPGQHDDPLHCTLITTAIDNAPAYIALSYVWGDPADIGHVTCSGITRPVTRSLLGGLRQLRHTETREMVWADAICINQADFKEKGGQVNLMGTIYDQAAEVLVWLGDDPKFLARHAFEALPRVNKAVTTGTHRTWYESDFTLDVGGGVKRPGMVSRDNTASMLSDRNLDAIKQMYQLPWFTRVWVLQEVGLATKATACWGDCRIDFCEIALFVWFAMHDHDLEKRVRADLKAIISGCPYYAVYSVWSTYRKKDSWIEASPPLKLWADHLADQTNIDFVLVLEASRTFNATDARDHVFAFLGHPCALLPGTKELLVKADYEISLEDLYHSVAQALSKVSLNFLVQAQNTSESLTCSDHASWIPRWASSISNAPTAFWEAWNASLRLSKPAPPPRIIGPTLHATALLFDTVLSQTNTMQATDFDHTMRDTDIAPPTSNIGNSIETCWHLTTPTPHAYPTAPLVAFVSVLECSSTPSTPSQSLSSFIQASLFFHPAFYESTIRAFEFHYELEMLPHRDFAKRFSHAATNRRFFVTAGGRWGLGPDAMREGDVCAILAGADVPFVLRPVAGKGRGDFRLVGQVYVYGVMYGELLRDGDGDGGWDSLDAEEIHIT